MYVCMYTICARSIFCIDLAIKYSISMFSLQPESQISELIMNSGYLDMKCDPIFQCFQTYDLSNASNGSISCRTNVRINYEARTYRTELMASSKKQNCIAAIFNRSFKEHPDW